MFGFLCVGSIFAFFGAEKTFEFFLLDVFGTFVAGVVFHSFVEVVCDASVEGAVLAFEDVDEPGFFFH